MNKLNKSQISSRILLKWVLNSIPIKIYLQTVVFETCVVKSRKKSFDSYIKSVPFDEQIH